MYLQTTPDFNAEIVIAGAAFFVSLLALGFTVYFSYWTAKYQLLSTSASLLQSFINKYDSPELKQSRQTFSIKLLDEDKKKTIDFGSDSEPVMELFEEIGYLTRKGVLDKGMVWNHFFWFLERYYKAICEPTNLIYETRQDQNSPTIYQEIEWLYDCLCKYDATESKIKEYIPPDNEQINKFLVVESKLLINAPKTLQ